MIAIDAVGGGAPTVVVSEPVSLNSFDSAMRLSGSTTAVSLIEPGVAGEVPLIVIVAFAPALTRPPVQSTVGSEVVQTKRLVGLGVTLATVTPGGSVFTTWMLVAFARPWLLTVRVYVSGAEGATLE